MPATSTQRVDWPALGRAVGFVYQQYGAAEVRPGVSLEWCRAAEVGVDTEVGTDASEDAVDVETAELGLEGS